MKAGIGAVATTAVISWVLAGCDDAFRFDDRPGVAADSGAETGTTAPTVVPARCTGDATCGGLHCHVASGSCVACLQDADCSGGQKRCEPSAHVCVACLVTLDCGGRQTCDKTTNRCLDTCFDGDDLCPSAGFICDRDRALCVECKSSASCSGSPSGNLCDVAIGHCVECTGNAQCPSAEPVCDRRSGRCVGCVLSSACGDGAVCDPVALACRQTH